MNVIIFDTETTGLPHNYHAHYTDVDNWPYMVQLAWAIGDVEKVKDKGFEFKDFEFKSHIIKPEGFTITNDYIHGISQERALEEGVDFAEALEDFSADYKTINCLIAHNLDFDMNVLLSNAYRYFGDEHEAYFKTRKKIKSLCTMKSQRVKAYVNKRLGNRGLAWPSLSGLHEKIFGEGFEGAHDALNDVKALHDCVYELLDRKIIEL